MPDDALLTSLLSAVAAAPDDVPLRLHVAELLADRGRIPEALVHCSHALTIDPAHRPRPPRTSNGPSCVWPTSAAW